MIPPSVAALLTIPIGEVVATAAEALGYREAYAIAKGLSPGRGTYFTFINQYLKANSGATRAEATAAYRAGKFWATQGSVLSAYPSDVPLDPRLARAIPGKGALAEEYGMFRTQVEARLLDKATGEVYFKSFYVKEPTSLSLEDLYTLAMDQLIEVIGHSPPASGETDIDAYDVTMTVVDFGYYAA